MYKLQSTLNPKVFLFTKKNAVSLSIKFWVCLIQTLSQQKEKFIVDGVYSHYPSAPSATVFPFQLCFKHLSFPNLP